MILAKIFSSIESSDVLFVFVFVVVVVLVGASVKPGEVERRQCFEGDREVIESRLGDIELYDAELRADDDDEEDEDVDVEDSEEES